VLEKNFGAKWATQKFENGAGDRNGKNAKTGGTRGTWGEAVLTPSIIYSNAMLSLLGRYGKKRACDIKAIAHVTGGGIPGNIVRVLGKYGAELNDIWPAHKPMLKLQEIGKVADREAYEVWNMGTGMIVISNEFEKISAAMKKHGIRAKIMGRVTKEKGVRLTSRGYYNSGKVLELE
jgi:phosphoribosylformylglycinamidine cyclo-ligase